jgi:lysylphosphatidylglycerol synthetase-like protein (DUF2156 family)
MKTRVIQGDSSSTPAGSLGDSAPAVTRPPDPAAPSRSDRIGRHALQAAQVARTLREKIPFTLSVAVLTLLAGLATTSLWRPLRNQSLLDAVAYGVPAFSTGRWWTPVTGVLFAQTPLQYVPTLGSFVLLCGFAEYRMGTGRAAGTAVVTQLAGVLGAAALLAIVSGHGWLWADQTALTRDVGFSAGALGAASAATATLSAPWRGRARIALSTYVVVSFVYVGVLWDLEHLLAVAAGLALGPRLLGSRADGRAGLARPRLTRREYRLLAAGSFVVSGLAALIAPLAEAGGPLATGMPGTEAVFASGPVFTVLWLLVAAGLRRGRRTSWRLAVFVTVASLVALLVLAVVLAVRSEPGWPVLTYMLAFTLTQLAILVAGRRAFANPSRRRARRIPGSPLALPSEDERRRARALLETRGTPNRLAWMTTWPENRWYLPADDADGPGYVAYRVHAGVALGLCDPVAATPEQRGRLLRDFADRMEAAGLVPCLFSVTNEAARVARDLSWQVLQVAEEAVIDLPALTFKGKAWQDVRTALNRAAAQGVTHRLVRLANEPRGIQVQVRAISEQWTGDKGLPEMGFTLGGVDEALDPHVRVGLAVDAEGTVHGVTSWMPAYVTGGGSPTGWALDVMRRAPDGFRSSMEFLIASACVAFQGEGAAFVSLSGVPLAKAGPSDSGVDRAPLDTFLDRLGASLEPYYGFRSLQAFKSKFQPRHEPLYLVFPGEAALPRIGVALGRAYLPDAGLRDLLALNRGPSRTREVAS